MALSSKGRRQREDLGKRRIALCHDDDGSSQVVADLCSMYHTNNHRQLFCGRGSSSDQDQSLDRVRRPIGDLYLLSARTRILQLRSRQVDCRTTVCKVGDMEVSPNPFRRASHGCVSHKRASQRRTPHRCTFQHISHKHISKCTS